MHLRFSGWLPVFAVLVSQTACFKPPPPVNVFRMGERVQVGTLIYNVFDTKWQGQIGEGPQARMPTHRFLVLHLTVVNSGAEVLSVPPFRLSDEAGRNYDESMEGQGIPQWVGMIRNLKPANTLEGNAVFDVEPKSYKLKLDDGSESGKVTMVDLPLQFDANRPAASDVLDAPPK